jgi:ubiquinol-cytochrome c reductase iron-sulfur subunit
MNDPKISRRSFLFFTSAALASGGAVITIWSLLDSMNPSRAVSAPIKVALNLNKGEEKILSGFKVPILIYRMTDAQIRNTTFNAITRDNLARNFNFPLSEVATLQNRTIPHSTEYVLLIPLCTREGRGCIVAKLDNSDDYQWKCPCCGAEYNHFGMLTKGIAEQNLLIPAFKVVGENQLELGPDLILRKQI